MYVRDFSDSIATRIARDGRPFHFKEVSRASIPAKLDGTRVQVITITNFPAATLENTKRRRPEIAVYELDSDSATRKISSRIMCRALCPLILSYFLCSNLMEF